jgi:peptidoglycan/xylan/chitin deacetylase (PgdA/CDA1 family)
MAGSDYGSNDHVALRVDLELIDEAGFRIVSLDELVDRFVEDKEGRSATPGDDGLVAITFDDGPEYDAVDFDHPALGFQRSFLGILEDFWRGGCRQRSKPRATSFVIASPDARKAMESMPDTRPYYLHRGAMNDRWWPGAIDSGFITIANHSWDHLHPGLASVAHSRQARADFTQVDNEADADAQVADATRYIDEVTGGRAAPFFAYPFGQYNRFLIGRYLPENRSRIGIRAAFTVDGRPLRTSDSLWCLPRFSCGYNWTSPAELAALLDGAR